MIAGHARKNLQVKQSSLVLELLTVSRKKVHECAIILQHPGNSLFLITIYDY